MLSDKILDLNGTHSLTIMQQKKSDSSKKHFVVDHHSLKPGAFHQELTMLTESNGSKISTQSCLISCVVSIMYLSVLPSSKYTSKFFIRVATPQQPQEPANLIHLISLSHQLCALGD
uniref:Uncharacterized protein n=1 Tax=Opuntia streptacantha TaxID=393608 RepID=A0A7C8Z549_OPUST